MLTTKEDETQNERTNQRNKKKENIKMFHKIWLMFVINLFSDIRLRIPSIYCTRPRVYNIQFI